MAAVSVAASPRNFAGASVYAASTQFQDRTFVSFAARPEIPAKLQMGNSRPHSITVSNPKYHERDLRLIWDAALVQQKLARQAKRAAEQMAAQRDFVWTWRDFDYEYPAPESQKGWEDMAPPEESSSDFVARSHRYLKPEALIGEHYVHFSLKNLRAVVGHAQNERDHMEDFCLVTEGAFQIGERQIPYSLFSVFDGHAGKQTAELLRDNLELFLKTSVEKMNQEGLSDEGIWNAFKEAFVLLDAAIKAQFPVSRTASGSTAIVCLKFQNALWTACVGDSRAVLKMGDQVIQLSEDQKPNDPKYKKAIVKRGGCVCGGRVNGKIAVARAFNNQHLVSAEGGYVVVVRPRITKTVLEKGVPIYLALVSDGVADVASSREIASVFERNVDLFTAAARLVRGSFQADSRDNLTALVTDLTLSAKDDFDEKEHS